VYTISKILDNVEVSGSIQRRIFRAREYQRRLKQINLLIGNVRCDERCEIFDYLIHLMIGLCLQRKGSV
jgi:hypothetical protein